VGKRRKRLTGEEILRHPAVVFDEVIRHCAMAEYVYEEECLVIFFGGRSGLGPQPGGDLLQQDFIIFHVFEHLL
jgi:hypothetical protein